MKSFSIGLLFVVSVILLGIYATRQRPVIQAVPMHPHGGSAHLMSQPTGVPPPAGESGFGIGFGAGVDLLEKPPMTACSTLSHKPASAESVSSEIFAFYQPASPVPTEYNPRTIGDCPPMKPMSSATPPANVPMCMAGQRHPLAMAV